MALRFRILVLLSAFLFCFSAASGQQIDRKAVLESLEKDGCTMLLMGKDAEAEKDFQRVLELNPSMATTVANRRAAVKKKKQEKPSLVDDSNNVLGCWVAANGGRSS